MYSATKFGSFEGLGFEQVLLSDASSRLITDTLSIPPTSTCWNLPLLKAHIVLSFRERSAFLRTSTTRCRCSCIEASEQQMAITPHHDADVH